MSNPNFKAITALLGANGTRIELEIYQHEGDYTICIPNFYLCVKTRQPNNIAYKLEEKGMYPADAKSAEWAVAKLTGTLSSINEEPKELNRLGSIQII